MLFQRIICIALLVLAAVVFAYSLSVITNVNENFKSFYEVQADVELFEGARIVYDMQGFVDRFITLAIWTIVVTVTLFISGTDKRRKYYVTNYISSAAVAVMNVAISVWALTGLSGYRARYNEIDFEAFRAFLDSKTRYKDHYFKYSTFWFDAGYVVFGVLLAFTVLLIANVVWKIVLMQNEKKLLAEGGRSV